jgi:SAM-dependent methyltransferase
MHDRDIVQGYAADAAKLVEPFEAISCVELFAPVADLLPVRPCRVLDVGAGTGRDAAWLAEQGHQVVAAEPVRELREAGRKLHRSPSIVWVDDRLPALPGLTGAGERFDILILIGVWQHLQPEERAVAIESLASLAADRARLIMSLRHGPGAPTRPCFPCDPDETIGSAAGAGLGLVRRREAPSIQQKNREAGVTWTWLAFDFIGGRGQSRIH